MARPKKEKVDNICKNCNNDFKTIPSLKRDFCTNLCAQQYKGKDKSWLIKREKTCLDKYGNKNAFASEQVQLTYKNNLMKKYGVDNPFLVKEFKDKAQNSIYDKYGSKYASSNDEIKKKISEALKGRIIDRTNFINIKYEKLISYYEVSKMKPLFDKDYLEENKINHQFHNKFKFQCEKCNAITEVYLSNGYLPSCDCSEYKGYSLIEDEILLFLNKNITSDILLNRRDILPNRLELDLYIPDYKLAIEVNGVYWHSESMGKYKDYHLFKTEKCNINNIELVHILDYEWIFKKPIIESILLNKLNKTPNKLYARKCVIKEVTDTSIIRNFLDTNHIQGYTHASINLGLYHDNKLVSLMTFSKNRFKKQSNEIEMVRFCNLLNYNIIGGASKLFKYFINNHNKTNLKVISFADRRFFNGNLYNQLGFVFDSYTSPSYIYWKNNKVLHRMSCQKHKLNKLLDVFDSNLSEYNNMINNGWKRVWDCGNSKYIK